MNNISTQGLLIIFNVLRDRDGSHVDSENLINTFEMMGAKVIHKLNPTANSLKANMLEIKKMDFNNYLYVAIAYFGHGTEDGNVFTSKPEEITQVTNTILIPLCKLKSLDKKLKLLIVQACKGKLDFLSLQPEGALDQRFYPLYYAKLYAASEGTVAYRHTETGSHFIRALCERLRSQYKTSDLISIMKTTIQDVKSYSVNNEHIQQIPCWEDNFPSGKHFFFGTGFT